MKIVLPTYTQNYNLSPFKTEVDANKYNLTFKTEGIADYLLYWGLNSNRLNVSRKFGVMETGFFHEAGFIDTLGGYHQSSLNTKYGYDAVANYDLGSRLSAREIIYGRPIHQQSKFNAGSGMNESFDHEIVLACQNPTDRSITFPHTPDEYWRFVKRACKFYGKNLFLKLHPWNSNEKAEPFEKLANKYGCGIGKFPLSLLKGKKFVITFNSTIAIDCSLLGVPYVQYAIGTFWNSYGIHFSNYNLPSQVTPIENAEKLADFLIHKYCFNKTMSQPKYAAMIHHFATSEDIFPMNDVFSYASNCV